MTTNNSVDVGLSGATGTGMFVGSTSPSITTSLLDTNGATWIGQTATASAVDYINISNAASGIQPSLVATGPGSNIGLVISSKGTGGVLFQGNGAVSFSVSNPTSAVNYINAQGSATGNNVSFNAEGSDSNIIVNINGKGTGGVALLGTSTNDDAATGYVGEFITSNVASGSAITATRNAVTNVTTIALTAGDWDVWGNVQWPTLGTSPTIIGAWTNSASTAPDASLQGTIGAGSILNTSGLVAPYRRYSLSGNTTIYLGSSFSNVSGNGTVSGSIYARRAR